MGRLVDVQMPGMISTSKNKIIEDRNGSLFCPTKSNKISAVSLQTFAKPLRPCASAARSGVDNHSDNSGALTFGMSNTEQYFCTNDALPFKVDRRRS